jgi:hypothetical protein
MKSLEEVMKGLEFLSKEEVENPEWSLEKMQMIHQSLTDDNFLSYVVYLSLRPDLPEDDRDTCLKLIKIKRALENRDIQKQYKHFITAG